MSRRTIPMLAALAMLFVAAACGQKPGVATEGIPVSGLGGAPLAVDPETGEIVDPTTGETIALPEDTSTTTTTDSGSSAGPTGSTSTGTSPTTGSTPSSGGGNSPTGGGAPSGGDSTGVTKDTITLGSHAPLTGAAPVPSDSAYKGAEIYWRWLHEDQNKTLFGRRVRVILKNDNYNPSQAVAVCKEMVERDKVFLLSGLAGTDQLQACARYAESVGVPYMSAGVTEIGLTGLRTYFATTMTYPDQAPLLADYLVNRLGAKGEKNGMVRFDTPNFQDAHDAFVQAMRQRGIELDYDRAVSKGADATVATTVVQEMRSAGIENVYVLTSPVWFIELMKASNAQQYAPQYVGVGITMTFDTILTASCPSGPAVDGSQFFSPFPAYIDSNKYDPAFRQASARFYPNKTPDDFMWLGWMAAKGLHQMLMLPGENLTRERYIYFLERARGLRTGIGPELNFSPTDHFGADQVHVSEARCSDRRWHTIIDFARDF